MSILTKRIVLKTVEVAVRVYQLFLSPFFGKCCRFDPTCSEYARIAFRQLPTLRALGLVAWRIARCGPWSSGWFDPVPGSAGGEEQNE